MLEKRIIENLLTLLSSINANSTYKDVLLFTEIHNKTDMSIYYLVLKGERDIGTPFYCGSVDTHIVKEDYSQGELVYASIVYSEKSAS